jgi:predicted RNA-binding protein YlqC (UPF0109 family)
VSTREANLCVRQKQTTSKTGAVLPPLTEIGGFRAVNLMKEFVAYIVKNLVDHPDKVKINEIGGTQTLIIELSVEKSDIGKIIGKKGKTINAIRTLLMSVASRNGIRVNLEILEENYRPESPTTPL